MSEAGYAGLITAAHQQVHGPVILIWDNLNTHISAAMRTFTDAHRDWLTVVRLPAYAPDLNLKSIQYRPELIGGFLAQTGLTLEPQPP
jgi:hypothetical protein